MSAINSTKEGTASSFQDTEQSHRRENFINRNLEISEDVDYCQQVFTITLICIQSNPIEDQYKIRFSLFLRSKYLPYLIKERDNNPMPPYALWMHSYDQKCKGTQPDATAFFCQMLDAHSGSDSDLEFRRFLDKNCQFLLELCRRPIDPMPASIPLTPRSNLELQLVLVDRALEAQSKASFPTKMESKMEDEVKGEVLGKLSELTESIKSVIEVVANGSTKTMSNGSNSLERPSKKRKAAPK
ncbi:hypothetical protein ACHAP3_002723 [Botrytis cinerea]